MNTALAVLITLLIISSAAAYKLPENKVLKESLCPSHIAGAERLVFNSLMHGVGSEEEFKKTIINKLINDSKSINYDFPDGVLDILKDVWDQRNIFPVNAAINIVVLLVLMILFMLYICLLNPFCWCCCSCCCMKNYENEVDDEYIEEMEKLPKGVDPPPFKTLPSRDSSRDDCCSCCCCCCGRKCGYCCLTFAFLCCLVAIFFGFYAFASHPLSNLPSKLVGDVDTNEEKGILRMVDIFGKTVKTSLVPILRETVLKDILADLVLNDTVSSIAENVLNDVNLTVISSSFKSVVKTVDGVVTPDELQAEIDKVNTAKNKFPNETFVNDQLGSFNESIKNITDSISDTTTSVDSVKTAAIGIDALVESVLKDINDIDKLIYVAKTPLHDVYKKYEKLSDNDISTYCFTNKKYTEASSNKDCKKIIAFGDSLSEAKYEKDDLKTYGLALVKSTGDKALTQFKAISGIKTSGMRMLVDDNTVEVANTTKELQEKVDKILLTDVISNLTALSNTLNYFSTNGGDSLIAIIDQINNTLSSLPNFTALAGKIEGLLAVESVVGNIQDVINELDKAMNSIVSIDGLGSINETFSQITDIFSQVKDKLSLVTDPIKTVDKEIANINIQSFYDIISDNVTGQITNVMGKVELGKIIDDLSKANENVTDYIFDIDNVTNEIIDKLKPFTDSITLNTGRLLEGIDISKFDEIINDFYKSSDSKKTYKECYNEWKEGKKEDTGCTLSTYFSSNDLKPTNYKDVITKFNSLYAEVNRTSDNPAPYSVYKEVVIQLAKNVEDIKIEALSEASIQIEAAKGQMEGITGQLEGPRNILNNSVKIDEFSDYIKDYREYRQYLDNTTALFENIGIKKPEKNEYDNNTFDGKIMNLFMNPVTDYLETMDNMTDLLDNVMKLITDLPKLLSEVKDFDYKQFENIIKGYESWILKAIGYVFPNDPSFEQFLKTDVDYLDYKNVIDSIDKDHDKFNEGGYYLVYLATLGGKLKMIDMLENALSNTTGYLFAENSTDLICVTNRCIKETVNEVWNTAKLSLFTGKPEDDKSDNAKYLKYAGIGIGVVQTIVIVFPLFLFLIQLMYVGFRLKGHNCCCECQFSLVSCCCSCVLLLFAFFGIFGIFPMVLCNMVPDIADIVVQIDTVTNQIDGKSVGDINMSYYKDGRIINLNGTVSDTNINANISIEQIVSGYLGGNCKEYPAPFQNTVDSIFDTVKKTLKENVFKSIKENFENNEKMQAGIKDPIIDLLDNKIFDGIKSVMDSVFAEDGVLSCNIVNDMLTSLGDFACCDLMNDAIALSAASVLIGIFMFVSTCSIPCANVCLGEGDLTEFKTPSKEFEKKQKEEKKKGKEDEKERKKREREDKKSKKLEKKESNTAPEDNGAFQMRKKKK